MAFFFFILFIITAIFTVIIIFSSKRFSPVPYFPTQKIDLPLIVNSLNLKNNQAVFDLGAGGGTVIFAAAKVSFRKNLNTKFVAVEINPVLILLLRLRNTFHQNKKNIKIIKADMFENRFWSSQNDNETMKQFSNVTIYLYISPWFLDNVIKKILKELPNARIISYMYPIKSLISKERIIRGKNRIYIY